MQLSFAMHQPFISGTFSAITSLQQAYRSDETREYDGYHGYQLDQDVDRRSGCILERVADGVADYGSFVVVAALAAEVTCFDVLLGVVPGTARVSHEDSHYETGYSSSAEHSDYSETAQDTSCNDRSCDSYACRKDHFLE